MNLPSWVADWSIGWVRSPLSPPNFDGSASYFSAGESRSSIENIGDPNKLCIPGILVDVIKETLSADRDFQYVSTAEYISDMVHSLYLPEQYPHTSELRNYALFKTMTTDLSPLAGRTDKSDQAMLYPEFTQWLSTRPTSVESMPKSVAREQASNIVRICRSRYFLITERGYLELGPMTLEVGDIVCVLLGGNLPFILRRQENDEYRLVGENYVHGLMDGEAMQEREKRISKNSSWSSRQWCARDIVFAVRDHGHSKKTRAAEFPNWVCERTRTGRSYTGSKNCVLMFSPRLKCRSPTGLDLGDQLEDWDMALEALRDKEIWKHKGAEGCGLVGLGMRRSRNDKTVGGEKGAEDARWTGKGQASEWDGGKWCRRRETRSKRWVWRLLGGGKAVGFFGDFGKALG